MMDADSLNHGRELSIMENRTENFGFIRLGILSKKLEYKCQSTCLTVHQFIMSHTTVKRTRGPEISVLLRK